MALERSDVEKIAHLARLGLSEADLPRTTETLNNILGLIDQMQAVDTSGVEPLAHPLEATQRLRPDAVTETDHRDAYQTIAPRRGRRSVPGSESHRVIRTRTHAASINPRRDRPRPRRQAIFRRRADPHPARSHPAAGSPAQQFHQHHRRPGHRPGQGSRRTARQRRERRPARRADRPQGPVLHPGRTHQLRFEDARQLRLALRRHRGREAHRRRRRYPRQAEHG
ncbi:aspartyl/glutamyl-tRNA amidotransferase subunit C [Pseudomonas aeruginosa]|nr:aspartyl/glutamyl-tRNA amidotransferase subunit C [Pseudomonas aeruginosa]